MPMANKIAKTRGGSPRRLSMQEAVNFLRRVALLKETLEQTTGKDEPEFDLSKLDQLEDLLDKAKKDIRRPPASIDPKEYWALIVKNLKNAVEELIASEGLDAATPEEPTFESDLPLPSPEEKPQIEDNGGGEEDNSLEDFLGPDSGGADEGDTSEGPGEESSGPQENTTPAPEENTPDQGAKQESFLRQVRAMFSSQSPLSWKDLSRVTSPRKPNRVTKALSERTRSYQVKLRKLREARGWVREESSANLANGLAYIAAMVKGATTNTRLATAGGELFQKIQRGAGEPEEGVVIPFLKRAGINVNEEAYRKTPVEIPPAIKSKLISLATGEPRAKEALSKAKAMTLDQFSDIAFRIAKVSRKRKASNNPDWEKD